MLKKSKKINGNNANKIQKIFLANLGCIFLFLAVDPTQARSRALVFQKLTKLAFVAQSSFLSYNPQF